VSRVHRLAAAQTIPARGDVDANLAQHLRLTRRAAEAQVEVVVFPELSLTGYELELAPSLAFTLEDPRLSSLVEVASAHALTLVVGAPVRLAGKLHIGALILRPDGSVDAYTKHYLGAFDAGAAVDGTPPPAEATYFTAGDRNPLVALGERRAAVAVCADVGRPAHVQAAAERGATAYLASMFVIPSEFEGDAAKLRRYATLHSMTVVLSNYGGPTGGLRSAGRSSIWSPGGELVAELDATSLGLALAEEEDGRLRGSTLRLE
jgi:predicted amidohydrolase